VYDHLDSKRLKGSLHQQFLTGLTCTTAASQVGGDAASQLGLLAGMTWIPEDYVRRSAQLLTPRSRAARVHGHFADFG
jgi:hypothetical protein